MAVLATAVWRVRAGGSNTNGAGYDSGIASPGTDYTQQDAAQISVTDAVTNNTTTVTSATASFTSAHIANAIYLSGTGTTTGWYFVTAVGSSTSITVDRATGGAGGTGVTLKLGGAWADPFGTHITATGPMVAGNICYIRGAGTDNPSSNDYTTTSYRTPKVGDATNGSVKYIGENGRPRLGSDGLIFYQTSYAWFENIFFFAGAGSQNPAEGLVSCLSNTHIVNCAFDQNGKDILGIKNLTGVAIGCEVFSSTLNTGTAGTRAGINMGTYGALVEACNVHDCWGDGISTVTDSVPTIVGNIIAKCRGVGVVLAGTAAGNRGRMMHNTIDANYGHGIDVVSGVLASHDCYSNFITNHTTAAKKGINVSSGTLAPNNRLKAFWDFNWFYNNTADTSAVLSLSANDSTGTDPLYTDQTTQDYTLQSSSTAIGKGLPSKATGVGTTGASPAKGATIQPAFLRRSVSPTVTSYQDEGAVQRVMAVAGGNSVAIPISGRVIG